MSPVGVLTWSLAVLIEISCSLTWTRQKMLKKYLILCIIASSNIVSNLLFTLLRIM